MGIETAGGWTVPDDQERIIRTLGQACELCDLIIVTGGLGPTDDDLTRQAVAAFLDVELEFNKSILDIINAFFQRRGKTMAEKNRSQALFPAGSEVLDNPIGTAPGFWSRHGDVSIAAVPGVPAEMKLMFRNQIVPRIQLLEKGDVFVSAKLRCFGAGESDIAQKLGGLMIRGRNPLINCTCGSGDIVLHVIAHAKNKTEAAEMLEKDMSLVHNVLGGLVYAEGEQSLPAVVGKLLKQHHHTIALAESCTGGIVSQMITDIPGASDYFLGSWVTYSNDAKIQLGIPEQLIIDHGAVSEQVASVMAENVARHFGANIGVGITGIAGPGGGTEEKPVGLVYIGLQIDDTNTVEKCLFSSKNRQWIRSVAAMTALNMVRLRLNI